MHICSFESGLFLSFSLFFSSFFLSLVYFRIPEAKNPNHDFSHDVTLMPRCLVMTLRSLTRYNLNRGIPWKNEKKIMVGRIGTSYQGRCIANEASFAFFSPSFFLFPTAVAASLRRVFCRKQKYCQRTSGVRDTFPIFHRLVCVILLDNSSMRDRRLYSSASGIHAFYLPLSFCFFFCRITLHIITYVIM